jgi:hypothetical protein
MTTTFPKSHLCGKTTMKFLRCEQHSRNAGLFATPWQVLARSIAHESLTVPELRTPTKRHGRRVGSFANDYTTGKTRAPAP